jgi:hypothetical protein
LRKLNKDTVHAPVIVRRLSVWSATLTIESASERALPRFPDRPAPLVGHWTPGMHACCLREEVVTSAGGRPCRYHLPRRSRACMHPCGPSSSPDGFDPAPHASLQQPPASAQRRRTGLLYRLPCGTGQRAAAGYSGLRTAPQPNVFRHCSAAHLNDYELHGARCTTTQTRGDSHNSRRRRRHLPPSFLAKSWGRPLPASPSPALRFSGRPAYTVHDMNGKGRW